MYRSIIICVLIIFVFSCKDSGSLSDNEGVNNAFVIDTTKIKSYGMGKIKLSMYGFFSGKLGDLVPAENVMKYELNSPLFSDYAGKERFVSLPMGKTITFNDKEVFDFPEGTTLIKNFFYPDSSGKKKIIETRLLIHEPFGWRPITYIWNDEQTEAYFHMLGADLPVVATDDEGNKHNILYSVPDINQCKNCHMKDQGTFPIGPTARQLNKMVVIDGLETNQLDYYRPFISNMPETESIDALVDYSDLSHDLDMRARSYLDSNCGNCHRPEGSAKTSGLNLNYYEKDLFKMGVNKGPVAAGKASGDRLYDITAGNPDASIIVYRMESSDPEIMMPEMGRKLVHKEGVELIREWITSM
ncbi:MAG: hypothetical protein HKN68_05770 [Saprospiraceae bacterium]|nr:hypothetical protein [Saprospiraceae bacterium]